MYNLFWIFKTEEDSDADDDIKEKENKDHFLLSQQRNENRFLVIVQFVSWIMGSLLYNVTFEMGLSSLSLSAFLSVALCVSENDTN